MSDMAGNAARRAQLELPRYKAAQLLNPLRSRSTSATLVVPYSASQSAPLFAYCAILACAFHLGEALVQS